MSELRVILMISAAIVALIYLWSSELLLKRRSKERGALRLTRDLVRWLNNWWWVLGLVAVGLLILLRLLADNYGNAQLAADGHAFELIVGDDHDAYVWAARVDIVFAFVYGLFALSLAPTFRRWGGGYRPFGSIGCGLLVFGAIADVVENFCLLRLLDQLPDVKDDDIDTMTAVGSVKWSFVYLGGALVIGTCLIHWLWKKGDTQQRMGKWLAIVRVPYAVYLSLVVAFVAAASLHQRWAFAVLVPALLVCGSWLNGTVWRSRQEETGPATSFGSTRVRLSVAQLIVAVVLTVTGLAIAGIAGDTLAFLGLALAIMSLGSLLSELRQNKAAARLRLWLALLIGAFALLVAATVVDVAEAMLGLAVAAIVLGEVGTELGSEIYLRDRDTREKRWLLAGVGLVAVAVAAAILIRQGVDSSHAAILLTVLAVVVLMAAADGDALIIVLLLAVALVASTRPGVDDVDESVEATAGEPYILILGDSYTSGEGANDYLPGTNEIVRSHPKGDPYTNECRQSRTAWPFQLVEQVATDEFVGTGNTEDFVNFPTRVLFLGCSGAVTENIADKPRLDDDHKRHGPDLLALFEDRIDELGKPALVIVGIGGNDAGFGDIGATCIGPGDCSEVADVFLEDRRRIPEGSDAIDEDRDGYEDEPREGWPEALSQIKDDLRQTYAAIRASVGNDVPIVATAYPKPIATDSDRCVDTLLGANERAFINSFAADLNDTVRTVADDNDVYFLDLSDALATRGSQLCATGAGPAGINFLAFGSKGGSLMDTLSPKNWIHNSLHPTAEGHTALSEDAYRWFSRNWPLAAPYEPLEPQPDSGDSDVAFTACDPEEQTCSIEGNAWTKEQAMDLFRDTIWPLSALVLALWVTLLPVVASGRDDEDPNERKFSLMRRWGQM